MELSNLKSMQDAAIAIGSATQHIGEAGLELGKVALPVVENAVSNVPGEIRKTINQARYAQDVKERQHAAAVIGIGVACVTVLTVATVAHFASKFRKSRAYRVQKRQIKAALKREREIDETMASAVAMRSASAVMNDANGPDLAFAKEPGCFAILTYEPDVAASDPSAYRDVYVGASADMLDAARCQLDGKGNLYVHADETYGLPMYVAFFPCEESDLLTKRAQLVKALGADESYNKVSNAQKLD